MYISSDLRLETQINTVSEKPSYTLNFISRNLKYCPSKAKTIAYNSLVCSTLEYCATTLDSCLVTDKSKFERVQ